MSDQLNLAPRQKVLNSPYIDFTAPTQKSDLLNSSITKDNLVAILGVILSQGYRPTITSVKSDHGNDSALGPHSHFAGYALDLVVKPVYATAFIEDCIHNNHFVTKIGLGGLYKKYCEEGEFNGTVVFYDNDQDHIHLQTA